MGPLFILVYFLCLCFYSMSFKMLRWYVGFNELFVKRSSMLKMRSLIVVLNAIFLTSIMAVQAALPIKITGTGVIPYAFKKNCGTSNKTRAYILLGEEFCYQDQSDRFSSFGGAFDPVYDKTLEDVASREIHEETMGVFSKPTKRDPNPEDNRAKGMKYFKKRFAQCLTVTKTVVKNDELYKRGTFFVEVPYIKASKFKRVRKRLEKRKITEKCFLEKKSIVWVRAKRLLKLVENVSDPKAIQSTQSFLIKKSRGKFLDISSVFVRGLCDTNCKAILRCITSLKLMGAA